ncbi:MAG: hypothetical protein GY708_26935 [Actinomycetia bacterium]|nr:hypothetical protein [Actinomycetes bacterium]MCP4961732.1 hypothetical protein [Actinomycetes bacterium]
MDTRTGAAIAAFGLACSVGVGAVAMTAIGGAPTEANQGAVPIATLATQPEVIVVEVGPDGTTAPTTAAPVVIEYIDVPTPAAVEMAAPAQTDWHEYEDDDHDDDEYEHDEEDDD